MVDQQIVDYIKRQLDHGVEREKVRNFLISNGWQASVIDEAFNFIESSNPNPNVTETAMNNVSNNYNNVTTDTLEETENNEEKKPKKIGLIILIALGSLLLLAGGAFAYLYFTKSPILDGLLNKKVFTDVNQTTVEENTQQEEPIVEENTETIDQENTETEPAIEETSVVDNNESEYGYAYGESTEPTTIIDKPNMTLDTDNDGLTDAEEEVYGTDMNNPDTDGDGYQDGAEVQSGYNPNGEGKLAK